MPLDKTHNFSKFAKKDKKNRKNHAKDDISNDISPFINRIRVKNDAM